MPLPRIALAQIRVHAGRPDINVERMREAIARAREHDAEIVVFSEMCVPGYIIGDQWEIDALVSDFAAWSEVVREASHGLTVLFGNVVIDAERIGEDGRRRKYNSVLVCHDGHYLARPGLPAAIAGVLPDGVQPKTLHPNYRFFDDDRHFYSLRKLAASLDAPLEGWMVPFEVPLRAGGTFRFGAQLCEDIWCADYEHAGDILDGVRHFHHAGAEAVFNLSASPWTWQKGDKRNRTVAEVLERSPLPFFYVNHVGAQNNGKNIIVFDGDSAAYAATTEVRMRARGWRAEMLVIEPGTGAGARPGRRIALEPGLPGSAGGGAGPETDPGAADPELAHLASNFRALVTGLTHLDEIRGTENRFLIGASGGIDSSLVLCLLVCAFGPERVFAINMPTRFNADITQANARELCARLGVDYLSVPIDTLYQDLAQIVRRGRFARSAGDYTRLMDENIQARVRGADILAGFAAKHGLIFTNNGNKTEVALGYATLYGDVNGAVAPIADLYKTEVFALARYLNERVFARETVPTNLYDGSTVPSAELSAAQDVTQGLGDPIKYGYHDAVLRQLIEYRVHTMDLMRWYLEGSLLERIEWPFPERLCEYFTSGRAWVDDLEWLERQMRINYFKRIQAPPIIVLSKRAFGYDLRESQLPDYRPREHETLRQAVMLRAPDEIYS